MHKFQTKFYISGILKDENEELLEMVWPELKANVKITQL